MDLIFEVQVVQEAHKDLFGLLPGFSPVFTLPMRHSPGREPDYVKIYIDDLQKWIFPFLVAFLNKLTAKWTKPGRCQRTIRAGGRRRRLAAK
jgi:hypothetical protein